MNNPVPLCLYFGKYKGVPLPDVPSDYLAWALRTVRLSSGIRQAIAAELASRGAVVPPPPPPNPNACWLGPCPRCRCREVNYRWHQFAGGVMQVRASCRRCGTGLGTAPRVPPFTTEADRHASA